MAFARHQAIDGLDSGLENSVEGRKVSVPKRASGCNLNFKTLRGKFIGPAQAVLGINQRVSCYATDWLPQGDNKCGTGLLRLEASRNKTPGSPL